MAHLRCSVGVAIAALAVAVGVVPVGAPAEAESPGLAQPPGTVALTSGSSGYVDTPQISATTAHDLVYSTNDFLQGDKTFALAYSGHTPSQVSVGRFNAYVSGSANPSNDYVWLYNDNDDTPAARRWLNLAKPSDTGVVPTHWVAGAPGGGLWISGHDLVSQTYAQAGTDQSTTVATLPAYASAKVSTLLVGPKGVAIETRTAKRGTSVVDYVPFATKEVRSIQAPVSHGLLACASISDNAIGCSEGKHDHNVERLLLSGAAPVITPTTGQPGDVAVTDKTTLWLAQTSSPVQSVPAAGGTATALGHFPPAGEPDSVGAHGNSFYLVRGGSLTHSGIYRTPATTVKPAKLLASPTLPLQVDNVTLSPGRVIWTDNSTTSQPVKSRALSTRGSTVSAARTRIVGATGRTNITSVGVSGRRTAWVHDSHGNGPTAGQIELRTGRRTVVVASHADGPFTLSGSRLLYLQDGARAHPILLDLATRRKIDLTATLHTYYAALWGNELAYVRNDGSIWEKRLASSAPPTRLVAPLPDGEKLDEADVYVWGDWVAWNRTGVQGAVDEGFRNARTLSRRVSISSSDSVSAATADGLVVETAKAKWRLRPWTEKTSLHLPGSFSSVPAVDNSLVAWNGSDGPNDQADVAPLPRHFAQRPRSLGDPFAGRRLRRGHTWRLDLGASAPLTSCHVTITARHRHRTRTVALLPCASGAMKVGEIRVGWTPGHRVHPRRDVWVVHARNADGSLLQARGTQGRTTGKLHIV